MTTKHDIKILKLRVKLRVVENNIRKDLDTLKTFDKSSDDYKQFTGVVVEGYKRRNELINKINELEGKEKVELKLPAFLQVKEVKEEKQEEKKEKKPKIRQITKALIKKIKIIDQNNLVNKLNIRLRGLGKRLKTLKNAIISRKNKIKNKSFDNRENKMQKVSNI